MNQQPSTSTSTQDQSHKVESPLTVAATDSISDLYERDPITWTDEEVHALIVKLRAERVNLDVDQKPKTAKKKTEENKARIANQSTEDLLKDLGL